MKTILVTGATGFIGKRLVARLRMEGHEVIGLGRSDGDITLPFTLDKFSALPLSHVFHLAGKTYVPDSWNDPLSFHEVNVIGTANALEFCRRGRVPLTYISAYLYGQPESLPIAESSIIKPNNPYALSKHLAEELCRFYSEYYDLQITVARPFNVFGPGQDEKFLIPTIVKQVLYSTKIVVKDLKPRRDYLHLDDLIDGLLKTLQIRSRYNIYNFGTGASLSVDEVIAVIQKTAGTTKQVECDPIVRLGEIPDVVADISKAMRELDWHPKRSFEHGIHAVLEAAKGNLHE